MSRTKRGSKGPGFDYWSKRGHGINSCGNGYGKITKEKTISRERAHEREEIHNILQTLSFNEEDAANHQANVLSEIREDLDNIERIKE